MSVPRRHHHAHVLSEDVFRDVLDRERRRARRHSEPLALMTVTLDRRSALPAPAIAAALAAVTRGADLVGWCGPATIAAILHGLRTEHEPLAAALKHRVRREVSVRLGESVLGAVSIELSSEADVDAARDWFDVGKRALDVCGSLLLLLVLAPLLVVIAALLTLTTDGPVLFRQRRVGYRMRPFTMLKFRTMCADADHGIHREYVTRFIQSDSAAADHGLFKIVDDPRVTPLGGILRKTSLDELPQIWNVLRGDMSLVGPRPPLPYEVEQYKPWHLRRILEARPGLTGPWQVGGRSRTTFEDMVRLDLRYARTRSLRTDLRILLATPGAVIAGKGAC
jgi:lipopolysaccharide/colanic/teichoic acid biosynthesis glycosyltransferase